jgi:hypothetical protein
VKLNPSAAAPTAAVADNPLNFLKVLKRRMTCHQVAAAIAGKFDGRPMHPASVARWIKDGCPDVHGVRVKLRAARIGGRYLIDPGDLDDFFAALAGKPVPKTPLPTKAQARAKDDAETAEAMLAEAPRPKRREKVGA